MKKKVFLVIIILLIISGILFIVYYKNDNNVKDKESKSLIKEFLKMEIGNEMPKGELFFDSINGEEIKDVKILKDNIEIKDLDIGEYNVDITTNKNVYNSKLIVEDTTSPKLSLKNIEIKDNEKYDLNMFIESCEDNSNKECNLKYKDDKMKSYSKAGSYEIEIVANDDASNIVSEKALLTIVKDSNKDSGKSDNSKKTSNNSINNKSNDNVKKEKVEEKNNEVTNNEKEKVNVNVYDVKFVMDDGKNITIVGVKENDKVKEPNINSKEGRTFKEWQLNGKKYDFNTPVTGNITLIAIYDDIPVITYKYGVKISTINGKSSYDYSTYNAKTEDLKSEATSILSKNSSVNNELLSYVNELRNNEGSENLALDNTLCMAASVRAIEMAWANKFSHTRPNGSQFSSILDDFSVRAFTAGENIAAGQRSAKEVFNSWNKSTGHHDNMVNKNFNKIGIGKYSFNGTIYWVQIFTN